jgi:cytosine deaminase
MMPTSGSWPQSSSYVIRRASVPRCFLRESLPATPNRYGEDLALVDLAIHGGRIESIRVSAETPPDGVTVDAEGRLVWPALVDCHAHLDKGETIPRVQPDGTIPGALRENLADYAHWTEEDLYQRMTFGLRCAWIQGVGAIRTHLDYRGPDFSTSWDVFFSLKEEWKERVQLQAVGLASVALYSTSDCEGFADKVAAHGGVLGCFTDGLRGEPGQPVVDIGPMLDTMFRVASERNLNVDLHTDQFPDVFLLPEVARSALRTKYAGTILVDHCVSLALQSEAVVKETLDLCREARISFVSLPTSMVYLQDRGAGRTPRWRGVTLLHEIRAAGIPIALATDNCRDPWFPYGDHDMVELFRESVKIFQLDHPWGDAPATVGPVPASIMGLDDVGWIAPGVSANLILFRARNLNELLSRPQSNRLVLSRGQLISEPLPDYAELDSLVTGDRTGA